eukprot:SM000116S24251  [mRNA]  locus=s116:305748:310367:+ [translate_table: standard]
MLGDVTEETGCLASCLKGETIELEKAMAHPLLAPPVVAGNEGQYRVLIQQLGQFHTDVAKLRIFSQLVSYFDERAHGELLTKLLGISLWTCSSEIVEVLLDILVNLVSANSACLPLCLDMLVRNFLPPSSGLPTFMGVCGGGDGQPIGVAAIVQARANKDQEMAKRDEVLGRVHGSLRQVMELVPTATLRLQPIVLQHMPHRRLEKEFLCLYLESMFRLAETCSCTPLREQLLAAIIDRLIEIDVEIRWEDIVASDDAKKVYLFHMDLENGEEGPDSHPGNHHEDLGALQTQSVAEGFGGASCGKVPTLDEMADKMDFIMEMAFVHIQRRVSKGELAQVHETLTRSFQLTILDTYKSKFTQFLLYYFYSLAPQHFSQSYIYLLHNLISTPTHSSNTRMAAAAYLASFLSRAKYLSLQTVSSALDRLAAWCVTYVDRVSKMDRSLLGSPRLPANEAARLHSVFYSAFQALLYTLCFRLAQLAADPATITALQSLPLHRLFNDKLKPLEMCTDAVVQEYDRQVVLLKLDGLPRPPSSNERLLASRFGGENQLDTFFPFDPYMLQQSARFITPHFQRWQVNDAEVEQTSHADTVAVQEERAGESDVMSDYEGATSSGSDAEDEDEDENDEDMDIRRSYTDRSHDWPSSLEAGSLKESLCRNGLPVRGVAASPPDTASLGYASSALLDDGFRELSSPSLRAMPAKLPIRLPARLPAIM